MALREISPPPFFRNPRQAKRSSMSSLKREIEILDDPEAMTRRAAEEFVRLAEDAVRAKGRFTVALSGGSTPRALYSLLASGGAPYRSRVPWGRTHFFWGDERHVPDDHPESNFRMAHEVLLSRTPVPAENIHRIRAEDPDAEKAAHDYETSLRDFFGLKAGEPPRLDLVLLGMGADGHTASIFPGTGVIAEADRLVAAAWVGKFSAHRITLTPPVLNNAACVLFIVGGAEKADALRAVLSGAFNPDRFPAQAVLPTNGRLLWLVDRAAAGRLEKGGSVP